MSDKIEKTIIIGSGPAAWSAAIYAARANLEPLVFEGAMTEENRQQGTLPLGQLAQTTEVENYAGFPSGRLKAFIDSAVDSEQQYLLPPVEEEPHAVTGPELMNLMRQQARNFGTRVITDDVVSTGLGSRPLSVTTADNGTHQCHTLIVATGARANYLGLDTETAYKNRGVSACAVCDGALPRFRNRPLAVVGGGDSAVEEAAYLSKFASQVYMVVRRDELRASKIMQDRARRIENIEILWNHEVEEVFGTEKGGVSGLQLRNNKENSTRELEVSGLFLAIGHTPNTSFLGPEIERTRDGYIRWTTPQRTYTTVEGVFSAGDVSDDYYRQAITSAGTGCMAALDAERYLAEHDLL
ncbi:FAD-dependent oxidoreductase [Candidatus Laterigemmans baculatus]|uniref:FAD-dependent oxidoreductase n=1 Tax=Candidatus Laterigemmans baculatus TaxID=2770505 RepID=UPI0013D9CDBA|nr:FAD-dependent oxidoreductase [Candidatus Laterigemmans baculatus]